jgi:hypothetical protein
MKINEVVVEGFWSGTSKMLGAGLKGVVKGVADVVAPGSVDQIKAARNSANIDKIAPSLTKYDKDEEAQAILDELLKQAQANGGKVNFDDIKVASLGKAGLAEAQGQFNPQLTVYLIMKLQSAGVTIKGMPQAAGENGPQPKSIPGFTVANTDPLLVQYKKNEYTLNDEGEWSYVVSGKPINNGPLSRLLDQVTGNEPVNRKTELTANTTPPGTVITPTGITVIKNEQGQWISQADDAVITDPATIKELERRDLIKRQTAQMSQARR